MSSVSIYHYQPPTKLLRHGYADDGTNKNYKCKQCDTKSNKHEETHKHASNHEYKLQENVATATADKQTLISGTSIKFSADTANKECIIFDRSGYDFRLLKSGNYSIKVTAVLDRSIEGKLNVNINDKDLQHSIKSDKVKEEFKVHISQLTTVSLNFTLRKSVKLEYAKLCITYY